MASIINASTSSGIVQTADTSGTLKLQTASTDAVTIDTNQNVMVNSSTLFDPNGYASSGGKFLQVKSTTTDRGAFVNILGGGGGSPNYWVGGINYAISGQTYAAASIFSYTGSTSTSGILGFTTSSDTTAAPTERMRIDSSGRLLVNGTSSADSNAKIQAFVNGGNGSTGYIGIYGGGSSYANQQAGFQVGQANCLVYQAWDGSGVSRNSVYVQAVSQGVQLSSGGTSWSAISDERKKDIIEPIADAVNKVSTLRAVIGKYKDEENARRSFLIAQDVQAVLPEAVTIEDEGQETEKLLLSYTDVIPLLVASIKELKAELDATKAEVAALKGTV